MICLGFISNSKAQTVRVFGGYNFSLEKTTQSTSANTAEFNFKLFENTFFKASLSSALSVDLDHFSNEIKETNVFTTLKFEF